MNISRLNTQPARSPVNASRIPSLEFLHDSGPEWLVKPFLYDSFIHTNLPVYPGALEALYGLKFNPFRPDIPVEALYTTPSVDAFLRRIVLSIADGGFSMVTGEPGTGKSGVMRILANRLKTLPDVSIGTIEHPQSRTSDFYRELGDLFSVPLGINNRWASFKMLRERWSNHISTTLARPVLIIDEAQEFITPVLNELRILSSKDLDSRQLLCVIFSGDLRLSERFRTPELLPLGSRIRRRLTMEYAPKEELLACLDHVLEVAGHSALMTTELKHTLAEHSVGNYRIMMQMADDLLTLAADQDVAQLDEKLYLEIFAQPKKSKANHRRK